jgi:hypothetical protein
MLCTDVFTTIGVPRIARSDGRYKSFIRRNGRKTAISGLPGSVFGVFPQVFPQLWKTRWKARHLSRMSVNPLTLVLPAQIRLLARCKTL